MDKSSISILCELPHPTTVFLSEQAKFGSSFAQLHEVAIAVLRIWIHILP
jgi:hypothetical protein